MHLYSTVLFLCFFFVAKDAIVEHLTMPAVFNTGHRFNGPREAEHVEGGAVPDACA